MKTAVLLLSIVLLVQICATHVIRGYLDDDFVNEPVANISSENLSSSPRPRLIKSNLIKKFADDDEPSVLNLIDNDLDADNNVNSKAKPTLKQATPKVSKDKLLPIVLIPGLEGSRLTATLDKPTSSHYYCKKKAKVPFTIWVTIDF